MIGKELAGKLSSLTGKLFKAEFSRVCKMAKLNNDEAINKAFEMFKPDITKSSTEILNSFQTILKNISNPQALEFAMERAEERNSSGLGNI